MIVFYTENPRELLIFFWWCIKLLRVYKATMSKIIYLTKPHTNCFCPIASSANGVAGEQQKVVSQYVTFLFPTRPLPEATPGDTVGVSLFFQPHSQPMALILNTV